MSPLVKFVKHCLISMYNCVRIACVIARLFQQDAVIFPKDILSTLPRYC